LSVIRDIQNINFIFFILLFLSQKGMQKTSQMYQKHIPKSYINYQQYMKLMHLLVAVPLG